MPFGTPRIIQFCSGELACIYPVPEVHLSLLDDLLNQQLLPHWLECQGDIHQCLNTPKGSAIAQTLCRITPSLPDMPLRPELLQNKLNVDTAREVFFYRGEGREVSILMEINLFTPIPRPDRRRTSEEEPITIHDLPFPSSGTFECDRLANLISGFNEFGVWMYQNFPAEWNDKILYTWAELQKPESDRVFEFLKSRYEEQKDTLNEFMLMPSALRKMQEQRQRQNNANQP